MTCCRLGTNISRQLHSTHITPFLSILSVSKTGGVQGGFRGFSISLWTEALALLNGGPFIDGSDVDAVERGPMHELGLQSFTLLVLDPTAFGADSTTYQKVRVVATFQVKHYCFVPVVLDTLFCTCWYGQEVGAMLSWVSSSDTLPGVNRIRIPGDRGAMALQACKRHGVPLDAEKWQNVLGVAKELDLAP
eukprot:COSAG02_NODE_13295_length_1413_cov_1.840183_1_plen_190_part_10